MTRAAMDGICASYRGIQATAIRLYGPRAGLWQIGLEIPNVSADGSFHWLHAEAVCDDFGNLVLVAGSDGRVVLS